MKVIYLDNNATTMVAPEVFEVIRPYFMERYGNPSSMHSFGGKLARDVTQARERVARLIGAHPSEIVFNSGGTEADATAIMSALATMPDRREIVTTRVEHPAVLNLCKHLARYRGYKVHWLSVDKQGLLDMDEVRAKISDQTAIVSVMWANNETGVIFPLPEISQIASEHGTMVHSDAVQAVGKVPIDLTNTNIHFLSISGHKLHAVKGIGVLYVRRGTRFSPLMVGGHQELDRRAGTENVPGIVSLGMAAELAANHLAGRTQGIARLRDRLQEELLTAIPNSHVHGHRELRLPNTLNMGFEFVEGEAILMRMDEKGICASSGSACSSGSLEPSHVLRAMGVPFTAVHGSIRFSLSRYTTAEEIDFVLNEVPEIISFLRRLSPFVNRDFDRACVVQ